MLTNYLGLLDSSSVTVAAGANLQLIVDSNVANAINLNNSGGLIKSGKANLTFSSSNPNMNLTSLTVNGGGVVLDHNNDSLNSSYIGSGAALALGSGTLSLVGNASAVISQTFTGTTLQGGGVFSVSSDSQNTSITAGAITRSPGLGSTVNFVPSNSGSGVASISTTTPNGSTSILGGYATFNGTDWAVTGTGGGPFTVAPIATSSYATTFAATSAATIVHTNITSSFSAGTNAYTSDIRFNSSTVATL